MKRLRPIAAILLICGLIFAAAPQLAIAQTSGSVDQYREGEGGGGGAQAGVGGGDGGVLPFTGFLPTTLLVIGVGALGTAYVLRVAADRLGNRA